MNIDYIETSKFIGKDSIYLGDLKSESVNIYGWHNYSVTYKGSNPMKIKYNSNTEELKVSGSLPYFMENQNFRNDLSKLREAFTILSDTLDCDLMTSKVNCFESGITFESPFNPNHVFDSHYSIKGMERKTNKTGLLFVDATRQIKLYNAGYRLKKVLDKDTRLSLAERGYNPKANYIRLETHYKKPERYFRTELSVNNLFREDFLQTCRTELHSAYNSIKKAGNIIYPMNKRNCTLPSIAVYAVKDLGLRYGFNGDQYLKDLIKSLPEELLNKEDKKNRKKALNNILKKVTQSESSCFDLKSHLREALDNPFIQY